MIDELISRVFCARDIAHRAHWKSKSYAQHMALGAFYDEVIEAIDTIVECYQGQFGLVAEAEMKKPKVENIIQYLTQESDWIESHRELIANDSPAILNLLDSLTGIYLQCVYKLENLH